MQHRFAHAPAFDRLGSEQPECGRAAILGAQSRHRNAVPAPAVALQKKLVERRTLQLLLGAAAADVVFAPVADRAGIGLDYDFEQVLAFLVAQIDRHHHSEDIAHLVGNVLQQLRRVGHPNDLAPVVLADHERATLGIGEAADPFQVLVPPGGLPLDVLILLHSFRGTCSRAPMSLFLSASAQNIKSGHPATKVSHPMQKPNTRSRS